MALKAMVGVGVFHKPDMIEWMVRGIAENFPKNTVVKFYFEADGKEPEDIPNSFDQFIRHELILNIAGIDDTGVWGSTRDNILEHGVHRKLIEAFMTTDCDVLIIPQDDNRFQRPLLPDLERLWAQYGEKLGWISGRDGYDFGYSNMVCSPFSDSNSTKTKLPIGDHREVTMMNTGPVVYFRHVIEKVGMPPADMAWYWWDFWSLQCHTAGLTNILLSMDCLHEKFGRIGNNPGLFNDALVAANLKTLNERWAPVLGRNPL